MNIAQNHSPQPRILVAPNSYKECASSVKAAAVIAEALEYHGLTHIRTFPLSDGGDGFLPVCEKHFHLKKIFLKGMNCFNHLSMRVPIGIDNRHNSIYLEAAEIIGLKQIPLKFRKPSVLHTENFGELLRTLLINRSRASRKYHKKIIIGIGGTGTNDLGLGLCKAFGLTLFDKFEKKLEVIPKNYLNVATIILPKKTDLNIEVVLDVQAPLTGLNGMNRVFAKQKGANENDISNMEEGTKNIISILERDHSISFRKRMIGAGGGITLGLSLIADVNVMLSETFLKTKLGLEEVVQQADVIITGEGQFDRQSFMNKATGIVLRLADQYSKKVFMIVGSASKRLTSLKKHNVTIHEMLPYFQSQQDAIQHFKEGVMLTTSLIAKSIVLTAKSPDAIPRDSISTKMLATKIVQKYPQVKQSNKNEND